MHDGYYIELKQSVCPITDDIINHMFPRGNENNRKRAMLLIESGAIQYLSIKYKKCKSRLDSNLNVIQFQINVTPSMKTKVKNETMNGGKDELDGFYTVFVSFDLSTKELLYYPYSICGCYDGRHVCSHFAAFLFFIRCAQMCDFNREMFENALPENPVKSQNTLTLIENMSSTENRKKAMKRKADKKALLNCNELF